MGVRVIVLLSLIAAASCTVRLKEMFSWNALDWNFPDDFARQSALLSGSYVPENALPVGIERWKNKLFVSVPRWKAGIPATLNYIPLDAPYEPSPKLNPYPSWEENEVGNCQGGLTTVYRIKADKCDRLWVLDVGTYGYDPNVTQVCPYALSVYDLNTDRRIRRYVFRPEDIVPTTFIANTVIDMGSSCEDTFAYFSDELGYGLIAYSWEKNKSWRFDHNFFLPDPLRGNFDIAGLNFNWGVEGIFGIATSPIASDGYRTLYFSPLASHTEFAVSTRVLRNETKTKGNYFDFRVVGVRGPDSHSTAKAMDENGVQLFSLIDQNAIGCWSSDRPYTYQNVGVVDKDDVGLVFPSDVHIDHDKNIWVMSDRMPVFLEAQLDYSDINFRIYTATLDSLIQGTVCEPQSSRQKPYQSPKTNLVYTNQLNSFLPNQNQYDSQLNSNPSPTPSFGSRLPTIGSPVPAFGSPIKTEVFGKTIQNSYAPDTRNQNGLSQYQQNRGAKVQSYVNVPKQQSIPYYTSGIQSNSALSVTPFPYLPNSWQKSAYEVYEGA